MKYIFDFDDVLFFTTRHRKEVVFPALEKAGVPMAKLKEYYKIEREKGFSLKKAIGHFFTNPPKNLYEEIMARSGDFVNQDLLEIIRKIGKENCYLITFGESEFQKEKIKRAGVESLFSQIVALLESKKEAIEEITARHRGEEVFFIDDKAYHFQNLDLEKYPNLKTILFDKHGLAKLKAELHF